MTIHKLKRNQKLFPPELLNMADPPQEIYVAGSLESFADLMVRPRVAIVGSRKVSPYGKEVTLELAKQLARRGITIISGLALGVDGLAHQAALETGGGAIAVLPTSLAKIYPATNHNLAQRIIQQGGVLISEYAPDTEVFKTNFVARNRIVAGLSQAVLITEAAEKSGSLHTARFALEQGKDVLAVPGNIASPTSVGTNNLIKAGATPVTSYTDVLHAIGLEEKTVKPLPVKGGNENEQKLLDLLAQGVRNGEDLLKQSGMPVNLFNQTLTMLEINGQVRSLGANQWSLN